MIQILNAELTILNLKMRRVVEQRDLQIQSTEGPDVAREMIQESNQELEMFEVWKLRQGNK